MISLVKLEIKSFNFSHKIQLTIMQYRRQESYSLKIEEEVRKFSMMRRPNVRKGNALNQLKLTSSETDSRNGSVNFGTDMQPKHESNDHISQKNLTIKDERERLHL